ncbi:hypothetical protein BJX99DRAFT_230983 [Aspergillus californicus]
MRPRTAPYDYNALEVEDEGERNVCKEPLWSETLTESRRLRKAIVAVTWLCLVIGAINLIAIVAILIYTLIKYRATADEDFAFYKNTRFEECAATVTNAVNCTALQEYTNYDGLDYHYIRGTGLSLGNGSSMAWCDMVSCFNGFKVIPSSVNNRAMSTTPLSGCWLAVVTAMGALWSFRSSCPLFHSKKAKAKKPCRGIRELGIIDWGFLIWDVCGPLFWWWTSFFLSLARSEPNPTLSRIAWTVSWKYAHLIQYHPYWCSLSRVRNLRRALPWAFGALAILQWGATFYLVYREWTSSFVDASYNCLATNIPTGPGTSPCTAQQLCSKTWLFASTYFAVPSDWGVRFPCALFGTSTYVLIVSPIVLALVKLIKLVQKRQRLRHPYFERSMKDYYHMWSPTVLLAFFGIGIVAAGSYITAAGIGLRWNRNRADAFVAVDYACRAVHVGVSPWRFYLDVGAYARPLRVAMLWFGV